MPDRKTTVLYLSFFSLYLLFRAVLGAQLGEVRAPDTSVFEYAAGLPIWDAAALDHSRFFDATSPRPECLVGGPRPFLVPLVYRLLGNRSESIIRFQLFLSSISWIVLSISVARRVHSRVLRAIALMSPLAIGLSAESMRWDVTLLSESISISLMLLLVAAWFRILDRPNWWNVALVGFLGFLWGATRDSNSILLLLFAVPIGVLAISRTTRSLRIKFAFLSIALLFTFLMSGITSDLGERWTFPTMNVIAKRILPYPERTKFFAERGMPTGATLMNRSGEWASSDSFAFSRDPSLREFREWLLEHGRSVYASFLIEHPLTVLEDSTSQIAEALSFRLVDLDRSSVENTDRVIYSIGDFVYPVNFDSLSVFTIAIMIVAVHLASREHIPRNWIVPAILLVMVWPHYLLVWIGDAMEVGRHSISIQIQFRLASWILFIFVADKVFARGHRTTDCEKVTSAGDGAGPAAVSPS